MNRVKTSKGACRLLTMDPDKFGDRCLPQAIGHPQEIRGERKGYPMISQRYEEMAMKQLSCGAAEAGHRSGSAKLIPFFLGD